MRHLQIRAISRFPGGIAGALVIGAFAALVIGERLKPLRAATEPKLRRDARNLAVAALGAATVRVLETPVVTPLAELVERRRWGILQKIAIPRWLEIPAALLLMDYSLYIWHVLLHRVPLLWRFHQVHHVDLDLSASSAVRFHFGELALSVPWRVLQVLAIGTSPRALKWWQNCLLLSIMFHHSNLRLPVSWERRLVQFVVTPRMHGIHHSIVPEETNSNWSSGLAIWDWLHGTLKLNIPQRNVAIGIPAYRRPDEVTLPHVLQMPFQAQSPSFMLPDGSTPQRATTALIGEQVELAC